MRDGVYVPRRLCAYLEAYLRPGLAGARRDDHRLPHDFVDLLLELRAAAEEHAASVRGSGEVRSGEVVTSSPLADEMTTHEAAEVLGITARGVRFAIEADKLEGRKVGRVWLVDRLSVMEHAERRREAG